MKWTIGLSIKNTMKGCDPFWVFFLTEKEIFRENMAGKITKLTCIVFRKYFSVKKNTKGKQTQGEYSCTKRSEVSFLNSGKGTGNKTLEVQ